MTRRIHFSYLNVLISVFFLFLSSAFSNAKGEDKKEEKIIFETNFGDLVFELNDQIAPKHAQQFRKIAERGYFESVNAFRIQPGFVIQFSDIYNRKKSLPDEVLKEFTKLPLEISNVKHIAGVLSAAREDNDKDSAHSSFSILLGSAPHLDGNYTIFGKLLEGQDVISEILKIPRNGTSPEIEVVVQKSYILRGEEANRFQPKKQIFYESSFISQKKMEEKLKWLHLGLCVVVILFSISLQLMGQNKIKWARFAVSVGLLLVIFMILSFFFLRSIPMSSFETIISFFCVLYSFVGFRRFEERS